MADKLSPETEVLTSDERWQRWEQRGGESDASFRRHARAAWISAGTVGLAVFVLLFLVG